MGIVFKCQSEGAIYIMNIGDSVTLSIVCLVYNHEPYLRQALNSLIMQKISYSFEVILGEDHSTDNSRVILVEYEQKHPGFFTMFYRDENMGATSNGYDLLKRTKGKYISILETDDYFLDPYALQKQIDFLENNPEYIGVSHDYVMVDENMNPYEETFTKKEFINKPVSLKDFLKYGRVARLSCGVFRNFMLDGDDYSIIKTAHSFIGDHIITSILLSRGDFFILPYALSVYRRITIIGGGSAASIMVSDMPKYIYDYICMLNKAETFFHGKIRYEKMRSDHISIYIHGWLRHKNGFTFSQLVCLLKNTSLHVHWNIVKFIMGYPGRIIKKLLRGFKRK